MTHHNNFKCANMSYVNDNKLFSRFASLCANHSVPGNLLTVVALLRCQKLRSHATTAFVISLAASDLLFSAINLPLTASRYEESKDYQLLCVQVYRYNVSSYAYPNNSIQILCLFFLSKRLQSCFFAAQAKYLDSLHDSN